MKRVLMLVGAVAATALATAGASTAAEKVELKNVHMCCDGCAEEVATVLGKVGGVTGVSTDKKTTSATFTAADAKAAQKALDALAAAGFHGDPGKDKGYVIDDSYSSRWRQLLLRFDHLLLGTRYAVVSVAVFARWFLACSAR